MRGKWRAELEFEGVIAVADSGFHEILAEQLRAGPADLRVIVENDERNRLAGGGVVLHPATQFMVVDEVDRSLEHSRFLMIDACGAIETECALKINASLGRRGACRWDL